MSVAAEMQPGLRARQQRPPQRGSSVSPENREWAKAAQLHIRMDGLIQDLLADVDAERPSWQQTDYKIFYPPERFDFEGWLPNWAKRRRSRASRQRSSDNLSVLLEGFKGYCELLLQSSRTEFARRIVDSSLKVWRNAPSTLHSPPVVFLRELRGVIDERIMELDRTAAPRGEPTRAAPERSKFDASEDVQGHRVEAAPRPMQFYPRLDYNPLKDPLQVVREMQTWHDPRGRLWPRYAIRALTQNCMQMIDQHSQGEPREVVVPLFTYSTFFFHRKLWAVWLPFQGGGKWWSLPGDLVLSLEKDLEKGDIKKPHEKAIFSWFSEERPDKLYPHTTMASQTVQDLNHLIAGLYPPKDTREREGDAPCYSDEIRFSPLMHRIAHRGRSTRRKVTRSCSGERNEGDSECTTDDNRGSDGGTGREGSGSREPRPASGAEEGGESEAQGEGSAAQGEGSADLTNVWTGLDVWYGLNTFEPHTHKSLTCSSPSVKSTEADATIATEPNVYLARYSAHDPHKKDTLEHPLHDNVGWLPMPVAGAMFKVPAARKGTGQGDTDAGQSSGPPANADGTGADSTEPRSAADEELYHAHKGTSFVRLGVKRKEDDRKDGLLFQSTKPPELASFSCFPPPGVLEYVFSKRSQEKLELKTEGNEGDDTAEGGRYQYSVHPVRSTDGEALKDLCLQEKNQASYKEKLHNKIREFLKQDDSEKLQGTAIAMKDVFRSVYKMKTGDDMLAESTAKPSALAIAHALDVQVIQKLDRQPRRQNVEVAGDEAASSPRVCRRASGTEAVWAAAFSGKPCAIYGPTGVADEAHAGAGRHAQACLPWFRLHRHFEDQPYWHLNAAMRSLQLGPPTTSVTVSQDKRKGGACPKALGGTYACREPVTIGAGLSALAASFELHEGAREMLRCHAWHSTLKDQVRIVFRKRSDDPQMKGDLRQMTFSIRWRDPVAEMWCQGARRSRSMPTLASAVADGDAYEESSVPEEGDELLLATLAPYEDTWRNADSPRESSVKAHWRMRGLRLDAAPWPLPSRRRDQKAPTGSGTREVDDDGEQTAREYGPAGGQRSPRRAGRAGAYEERGTAGSVGTARCHFAEEADLFSGAREQHPVLRFNVDLSHLQVECKLSLGPWLLDQCRPLMWQIDRALHSLSPVVNRTRVKPDGNLRVYRGLRNAKLNAKVYAHGNVLLWGQFSSTSTDQGVAQSFADGQNASVFTLQGATCTLIAPWSRFGREEEWLFPPNSFWLVKAMLTEEQQQILGKSDIQLYEMKEVVTNQEMDRIQVRYSLSKAGSVASASVIFQAETALESGGFLNLSLDGQVDDGSTKESWIYSVRVTYDGWRKCPLQTSTQWMTCDASAAEGLFKIMVAGETTGVTGFTGEEGRRTAAATVEQGIYTRDGDHVSTAVLENLDKILHVRAEQASLGFVPQHLSSFEVKVYDPRWDALLTIRKHEGRPTSAIEDAGAYLLAEILHRGVRLKHVDVRNNGITQNGTRALLEAVRSNAHVHACDLGTVRSQDTAKIQDEVAKVSAQAHEGGTPMEGKDRVADQPDKMAQAVLSQGEEARAMNIRCLHNQGRIAADKMEAFGSRWSEMAAYALYDCDSIRLDFAGLFERDQRQATSRTFDFIRLVFKYRFRKPPKRYDHEGKECDRRSVCIAKKISLPGALVAACTFAGPDQVEKLLGERVHDAAGTETQAMDHRETDQFGESPVIKARRRLDRARLDAGESMWVDQPRASPQPGIDASCRAPGRADRRGGGGKGSCAPTDSVMMQWERVIGLLQVAPTEEFRPDLAAFQPDVDPDEEYWKLKNLGLLAMRMWEKKMRRGDSVASEVSQGFKEHFSLEKDPDIKSIAQYLQMDILHNRSGTQDLAFGKTPVERVRVSLLCHALFVFTNGQWVTDCIPGARIMSAPGASRSPTAITTEARQKEAESMQLKEPDKADIPALLRDTCMALYDPQSWGTEMTQQQHRDRLERWVLSWAMTSCIIADSEEQIVPNENPLVKHIHNIPAMAFAKLVTLRKGSPLAMAYGAIWNRHAEVEEANSKLAEDKADGGHAGGKGAGGNLVGRVKAAVDNRLESSLSFKISGRYQGVAVQQLFQGGGTTQSSIMLPCLMYNLVGVTDANESKDVIEVQLVTRGSLLASDVELMAWRDTVLRSAVQSEAQLWADREPDAVQPGRDSGKDQAAPRSTGSGQGHRAELDQDSQAVLFCSYRARLADRKVRRSVAQRAVSVLRDCSAFRMRIRNELGWEWSFGSLSVDLALPFMMRPAAVLLYCLQRDRQRMDSILSSWYRNIELRTPILEQGSREEVVIDHRAVDAYCRACRNPAKDTRNRDREALRPEIDEDLRIAAEKQGGVPHAEVSEEGKLETPTPRLGRLSLPSQRPGLNTLRARDVFGKQQFRITVGELQQLVRSTDVVTIKMFPPLFYQALCRRFTCHPRFMSEMRSKRFLPLREVAGFPVTRRRDEWDQQLPGSTAGDNSTEKDQKEKDAEEAVLERRKDDIAGHGTRASARETKEALKNFCDEVVDSHAWFGFESQAEARCLMAKSVAQLANAMCISQKGYFMTDSRSIDEGPAEGAMAAGSGVEEGKRWTYNQICPKSDSPVVFLCAAAIDFYHTESVSVELDRYFPKSLDNFKLHGDMALYQRIRAQYECIFKAARDQGVRNPSMLPLGCGQALTLLKQLAEARQKQRKDQPGSKPHDDVCTRVERMYFQAQFELLSREDWGFENYYINARDLQDAMIKELEKALAPNGACNNAADGRWLRCNIVFHKKDAKSVAQMLAIRGQSPAFLVPTDTEALLFGLCGRTWEVGRLQYYHTDQDWAATSTGILGSFSICGPALGLDDIVLQLQGGKQLRLCVSEGQFLCVVEGKGMSETFGPFRFIFYDPKTRKLEVDTARRDTRPPGWEGGAENDTTLAWKVARVPNRVLLRELARIYELGSADKDKGIQVEVPTQVKELQEGRLHKADPDSSLTLQGRSLKRDEVVRKELAKCGIGDDEIKRLSRTKGLRRREGEHSQGEIPHAGEKVGDTHCFQVEFVSLDALLRAMARLPVDVCEAIYGGDAPQATELRDNKARGVLSRYSQGIELALQRNLVGAVHEAYDYAVRSNRKERFPVLSATADWMRLRHPERQVVRYPQELSRDTRMPCTLRPAWTMLHQLGLAKTTMDQLENPFEPLARTWADISDMIRAAEEHLRSGQIPKVAGQWPYKPEISSIRWPAYRNPHVGTAIPIECTQDVEICIDGDSMDKTVRELPADIWYELQCEEEARLLEGTYHVKDYQGQQGQERIEGAGKQGRNRKRDYYEKHDPMTGKVELVEKESVQCGKAIFGKGKFEVMVSDVCQLVESAVLITSGDCVDVGASSSRGSLEPAGGACVPHDFLTALIGRFTHSERFGAFFRLQRYVRMNQVIDADASAKRFEDTARVQAKNLAEEYKKHEDEREAASKCGRDPRHFMSARTHYWDVGDGSEMQGTGKLQNLTLRKMKVVRACQRLNFRLDTSYHRECIEKLKAFLELVEENPRWLGFRDRDHVSNVLGKAMADYATEACLAAKGYFLVGGNSGYKDEVGGEQHAEETEGMNQLRPKTKSPITFLCTAGIDFGTIAATKEQAPRYFTKHPTYKGAAGWTGWNDDGKALLEARVRTFYTVIFTAAKKNGVNTPCMLPIGLGVFLAYLDPPKEWFEHNDRTEPPLPDHRADVEKCQALKSEVIEIYCKVQFELLCEKHWQFDTYYVNAREHIAVASKVLDELAPRLYCNVVLHNRDSKFLAIALTSSELRGEARRVSFLNLSDTNAVLGGEMGMYWTLGRGPDYVGEEDFAATSTGCLLNYNIAGRTLGIHDVHLLLGRVTHRMDELDGVQCGDAEAATLRLKLQCKPTRVRYEFRRRSIDKVAICKDVTLTGEKLDLTIAKTPAEMEIWELKGHPKLIEDQKMQLQRLLKDAKDIRESLNKGD